MKRLIILLSLLFIMGCIPEDSVRSERSGVVVGGNELKEFEYEGCEYLYKHSGYQFGITHKGNCTSPIHKCK